MEAKFDRICLILLLIAFPAEGTISQIMSLINTISGLGTTTSRPFQIFPFNLFTGKTNDGRASSSLGFGAASNTNVESPVNLESLFQLLRKSSNLFPANPPSNHENMDIQNIYSPSSHPGQTRTPASPLDVFKAFDESRENDKEYLPSTGDGGNFFSDSDLHRRTFFNLFGPPNNAVTNVAGAVTAAASGGSAVGAQGGATAGTQGGVAVAANGGATTGGGAQGSAGEGQAQQGGFDDFFSCDKHPSGHHKPHFYGHEDDFDFRHETPDQAFFDLARSQVAEGTEKVS